MQGFLSDLFGGGGSKADAEQHAAAEDGAEPSPDTGAHGENGTTWTDADGVTHTGESGQDVTTDTELDAVLGTDAHAADDGSGASG